MLKLLFLILSFSTLAKAENILWIGDSQTVSSLATIVNSFFQSNHHRLFLEGRRGASPAFYINRPTAYSASAVSQGRNQELRYYSNSRSNPSLENLMREHHPQIVVVQLGGNLLHESMTPAKIDRQIERTLEVIEANPEAPLCYWIGPPPGWGRNPERFRTLYRRLHAKLTNRCYLFDPRTLMSYSRGVGDGIHYDKIIRAELVIRGICDPIYDLTTPNRYNRNCASGPTRYLHMAVPMYENLRQIYRNRTGRDLGSIHASRYPTAEYLEQVAKNILEDAF